MISLEELKRIEPALENKSDEELTVIRNLLYGQAQLAIECFIEDKCGSNNPLGVDRLLNLDM